MDVDLALRPITDADMPFLRRVYASTREDELAITGWSREQRDAFLRQQFDAQHGYYQQHFAGGRFDVILADGEPVGRLYVWRDEHELRIIDIAFLETYRRKGLGSRLLDDLLAEAQAAGTPARIHVEHDNPALALYRRLGFRRIGDTGVYYEMEWNPQGSAEQGRASSR